MNYNHRKGIQFAPNGGPSDNLFFLCLQRIRISEILAWIRKSYLIQVILSICTSNDVIFISSIVIT